MIFGVGGGGVKTGGGGDMILGVFSSFCGFVLSIQVNSSSVYFKKKLFLSTRIIISSVVVVVVKVVVCFCLFRGSLTNMLSLSC